MVTIINRIPNTNNISFLRKCSVPTKSVVIMNAKKFKIKKGNRTRKYTQNRLVFFFCKTCHQGRKTSCNKKVGKKEKDCGDNCFKYELSKSTFHKGKGNPVSIEK